MASSRAPSAQLAPSPGRPLGPTLPVGRLPDVPPPPELARRVQHVEVRHLRERRLEAVELVARLDERHVEGPAVEGHQAVEALRQRRERVEQLAFGLVAAEEELPRVEAVGVEEPAADQEGERPGAAAEARGLEVEEQQRPDRSERRRASARRSGSARLPTPGGWAAPRVAPPRPVHPPPGWPAPAGTGPARRRTAPRPRGRAASRGRSGARARRSRGRLPRAGRSPPRPRRSARVAEAGPPSPPSAAASSRAPGRPGALRSNSLRRDDRREGSEGIVQTRSQKRS